MSDKKRYDEADIFGDLVKQKLENHKIQVDAECWDEIEARMKPTAKRSFMRWIGSAAAVAALLAIALLFRPDDELSVQKLNGNIASVTLKYEKEIVSPAKEDQPSIAANKQYTPSRLIARKEAKSKSLLAGTTNDIVKEIQAVIDTTTLPENNILLASNKEKSSGSGEASKTPDTGKTTLATTGEDRQTPQSEGRLLLPKKEKSHNTWLLAASFSSGEGVSLANNRNQLMSGSIDKAPNDEIAGEPTFTESVKTLTSDEFSDIEHDIPLSFGLMVRKDITSYLGVETGLNYTYLSSKFKKEGQSNYHAKQELHYIGVPVNLVGYIWNDSKWNVYISAGGMVEKGVRSIYTQNVYQNNKKIDEFKDRNNIDGLQWSLNGAVGVSYTFFQGLGAYVEPKISYYFDNEQPISIRTEKNVVFGIGGGLRYKF